MFEVIWQVMRVGNIGVMRAWWSHPFTAGFFFIKVNREKQKQDSFCLMLTGSVCGWAASWHFLLTFYKTDKPIRIPTSHSIWASLKLFFFYSSHHYFVTFWSYKWVQASFPIWTIIRCHPAVTCGCLEQLLTLFAFRHGETTRHTH